MQHPYIHLRRRKDDSSPLIDIFFGTSASMVDINAQLLFELFGCQSNYLRIQIDKLRGETALLDCTTETNMDTLIEIGKKLLGEAVARVNVDTGKYEPVPDGPSNEKALEMMAAKLSSECKLRQQKTTCLRVSGKMEMIGPCIDQETTWS